MNLPNGTHTIKLVNTNTKNPAATDTRLNIDAIEIIGID
jgi:hypothetical protein